tara:strand:+ start:92 stop:496 length:405 start_codon:yes stop_codon:yes gene_type:complete
MVRTLGFQPKNESSILFRVTKKNTSERPRSSIGQIAGLSNRRRGVQISPGLPIFKRRNMMSRSKRFEQREDRVTTKRDKKNQNRSERKQRKSSIEDEILLEEKEKLLDYLEACGDNLEEAEYKKLLKKLQMLGD